MPRGAGWAQLQRWVGERRDWTGVWRPPVHHNHPTMAPTAAAPAVSPVAAPTAAPTTGKQKTHSPSSMQAPSSPRHCRPGCECSIGEFGHWNSVACGLECTAKDLGNKHFTGGGAWCPSVCGAELGVANSEGEAPQICKMVVDGTEFCGLKLGKTEPHGQMLAYTADKC
jgi:hypothetical protein